MIYTRAGQRIVKPSMAECTALGLGLGMGFGGGASAAPWSPLNVTSAAIKLWLRADKGTTIATGVSAWADQSGTGDANKNATQATGSMQPTLTASDAAYNNQATLHFSAAAQQLLATGTWASSFPVPRTIFVIGHGSSASAMFVEGLTSVDRTSMQLSAGLDLQTYASQLLVSTALVSSPCVMAATFTSDATAAIFVSALTANVTGPTGGYTTTGLTIGAYPAPSNWLTGTIAEIAGYAGILSAPDFAAFMGYAGTRYGLTIGA